MAASWLDLLDRDRRDARDLVGVLPDRPVAGELPHVGHVQDRLPRPRGLIAIGLPDPFLPGAVRGVVPEQQIVLPPHEPDHPPPAQPRPRRAARPPPDYAPDP